MIDFQYKSATGTVKLVLPDQMTADDLEFVEETMLAAIAALKKRLIAERKPVSARDSLP